MIKELTKKIKFPEGRYYIGDLAYVIHVSEWDKFVNKMENNTRERNGAGKCVWKKGEFWWHNTYDDNGVFYLDNTMDCKPVGVATGSIGIIPTDLIGFYAETQDVLVETFDKPFDVWYDSGVFHFGDWIIDTRD